MSWFLFMDDDIYIRPIPMASLISSLDASLPQAFVGQATVGDDLIRFLILQ